MIAWPPLVLTGCAVAGVLLHFIFPLRIMNYGWALAAAVILTAFSGSLALWAGHTMKAAGTNVRPDRPALAIVSNGPYRRTRNPMYLSLVVLQLALGLFLNDWIPAAFAVVLLVILHFGVVRREEIYLEAKFGKQYFDYRRTVRRWI